MGASLDSIAVKVMRGSVVESTHRAAIAVADRRGRVVASLGDPKLVTFVRSTFKPFQALPVLESGAAERFRFTDEELAVICSSHNGEEKHTALVASVLSKIGLSVDDLGCGAHAPYHKPTAQRLGEKFTALHNNCSGKHSGMLAVCVRNGWDPKAYLDPKSPLQQRILSIVAEETGVTAAQIQVGTDGCSAPNFAVALRAAARAFARLANAGEIRGDRGRQLLRLRDTMMAHPDLVAGDDRIDTRLMRALPGMLWAKAGGEAFYGMALKQEGLGVALKIEDGAPRAVPMALVRTLEELGLLNASARKALEDVWSEPLRNWSGRTVGRMVADFKLRRAKRRVPVAV